VVEDHEEQGFDFRYGLCIPLSRRCRGQRETEILWQNVVNLTSGEHLSLDVEQVDLGRG